jgi:hypothetical protein
MVVLPSGERITARAAIRRANKQKKQLKKFPVAVTGAGLNWPPRKGQKVPGLDAANVGLQ